MTREDFENSTKCWICDNVCVEGIVKIRDNFHATGNYRDSAHRDCNSKVKLNHKIPMVLQKLKNYDLHLIMQEPGKFDFKINFILNELENI